MQTFSANDIDTGDTLIYATSSNPSHGTVVINPVTGAFTYTPDASYTGSDSFTWQVSDGTASSSDATVSISVLAGPEIGVSFIFVNDNGGSATTTDLLLDGATTTGATTTVSAGTHTVSSAAMSGYDRVIGGDCAADGTITVMNGDSKHCTVTFNDQAAGGGTPALGVEDKKPANGPISSIGPSFGTIANFSGMVLGASTSLPKLPAGCSPMLSGFFRSTMADTDSGQVKQLQQFLNDTLSTDLPLNGVFGPSTDSAVKKFQLKYAEQILAPWGISQPTGFVYLTTQRWINLMHCSTLDIPMPKLVPYQGQ